jgi:transposase InsO family protein
MANGSSASTSDYDLWHRRFGHPGKKSVEELPGKVKGVPDRITAPANPKPCDGCKFGKSKCAAFPSSDSRTEHLLDLIHMDLVEYPVQSIDGYRYTLTTLDDHSSFGLTWFLKHKSDTLAAFKQFVSWAERQSDRKLKSIRSDRGGEFLGREFDEYLAEYRIEHQLSVACSPQQNGRVERWQQTITQKAEAMRHHTGLSPGFWKLAVETAVHIYNGQPLRRHQWKPPITVWDGTIPDISYFRVFGCKAYVHTHKDARVNKLQAKAKVIIFVRYEIGTKGYRFWNPSTRSLVVARNITFDENSFPRRESGICEPEPVEANPPVQPEPTLDLDLDDLFSGTGDHNDRPLYDPVDHPHHQPASDNHQDSDDDDDLYYDPNAKAPPVANPDEPRFVMGPPAPPRPNDYLP